MTRTPRALVEAVWVAAGTQPQLDREEYVDTNGAGLTSPARFR